MNGKMLDCCVLGGLGGFLFLKRGGPTIVKLCFHDKKREPQGGSGLWGVGGKPAAPPFSLFYENPPLQLITDVLNRKPIWEPLFFF